MCLAPNFRAEIPRADFFPSLTAPTQTVSPWLVPPFRFITGVLAPLPLDKTHPPHHRGWDSASLPPLDLWQFLLPAADWYPATIQHFEWCVNLRGEHTLTSRLRGVLFPPARLSSEDPDFNIRPPTPCPALAATLDFPQTFLRGLSAHVQSPPGVGDTWDHTAGVRGVTRPPGLPWAVSTGLEGSRHLGECPLTRDCRRGGWEVHQVTLDSWRALMGLGSS